MALLSSCGQFPVPLERERPAVYRPRRPEKTTFYRVPNGSQRASPRPSHRPRGLWSFPGTDRAGCALAGAIEEGCVGRLRYAAGLPRPPSLRGEGVSVLWTLAFGQHPSGEDVVFPGRSEMPEDAVDHGSSTASAALPREQPPVEPAIGRRPDGVAGHVGEPGRLLMEDEMPAIDGKAAPVPETKELLEWPTTWGADSRRRRPTAPNPPIRSALAGPHRWPGWVRRGG